MLVGVYYRACNIWQRGNAYITEIDMKEYILSILAASTVGSLILILTPEGDGGGIKKHISLIVGLATIVFSTQEAW